MESSAPRKPYPSDVTDEEWAFVAPCLTLMTPDAPDLREVFNALRWVLCTQAQWRYLPHEFPPCAGYDGHKRRKGSKTHLAVDTLGHLLALHVTAANERERAQVATLVAEVQAATGDHVEVASVDQGYTGGKPAAAAQGIDLLVLKLPEVKRGFVLLPRRWVVERSFAWASRFRRLARDFERLPETVAGLHVAAFACLMLHRLLTVAVHSS